MVNMAEGDHLAIADRTEAFCCRNGDLRHDAFNLRVDFHRFDTVALLFGLVRGFFRRFRRFLVRSNTIRNLLGLFFGGDRKLLRSFRLGRIATECQEELLNLFS